MHKFKLVFTLLMALFLSSPSFGATTSNIVFDTIKERIALKQAIVQVYAYRVNFHLARDVQAERLLLDAARHWRASKSALRLATRVPLPKQKILAIALSSAHNKQGALLANLALKRYKDLAEEVSRRSSGQAHKQ